MCGLQSSEKFNIKLYKARLLHYSSKRKLDQLLELCFQSRQQKTVALFIKKLASKRTSYDLYILQAFQENLRAVAQFNWGALLHLLRIKLTPGNGEKF